jgi:hypothetical protein
VRPLREILLEEYWTVALRRREQGKELPAGAASRAFALFQPPKGYWVADPFLFEEAGETWLFFELFDNRKGRGVIACSALRADATLSPPQVVLEEAHHLSYPCVFRRGGALFLLPESEAAGTVALYRCVEFPTRWEPCKPLLENIRAVDSTLYQKDGSAWLFTAQLTQEQYRTKLLLFALDADNTLRQHSKSPVAEAQSLRPAGAVVALGGRLLRPAQLSAGGQYGTGIAFRAIEALNEDDYRESEAYNALPENILLCNTAKRPEGLHTYALSAQYEAVDLKFRRVNLPRIWWILQGKLRKK